MNDNSKAAVMSGKTASTLTISFSEYIVLSAFLTALTALSIDIMLPALPEIAGEFALTNANDRQLVVIMYFAGFGIGQLLWGPISDRFGRLPVLATGLCIFIAGSVVALIADSYAWLLAARAIQGLGSASSRVTVTAIARDLFTGARMSRVMSLIMSVFIAVPILAPLLGQLLLLIGSWRLPFYVILTAGVAALAWSQLRLPETNPATVRAAPMSRLATALAALARQHRSLAYMVATGLLFCCLCAFIASAQQIFGEYFGLQKGFVFAFSSVALTMAAASLTNARIVMRRGMRRVCHTALTLFFALSAVLAVTVSQVQLSLFVFLPWLGCLFFLFSLTTPNLTAIVLEPMGASAGLAASVMGFSTTLLAAVGGWLIGSTYDGTLVPFATGFALSSGAALALVWAAEGRTGMFAKDAPATA